MELTQKAETRTLTRPLEFRAGDSGKKIGLAQGIQNALLTPNEGRALDNRPPLDGGDDLLIQGATVPIGQQPDPNAKTADPPVKPDDGDTNNDQP